MENQHSLEFFGVSSDYLGRGGDLNCVQYRGLLVPSYERAIDQMPWLVCFLLF